MTERLRVVGVARKRRLWYPRTMKTLKLTDDEAHVLKGVLEDVRRECQDALNADYADTASCTLAVYTIGNIMKKLKSAPSMKEC